MDKYYIKPDAWSKIYEILKENRKIRVKNEGKTRRFFEGVYFIMRTGAQWRELPSCYGKWRSVHKRYEFWCRKDFWNTVYNISPKIKMEKAICWMPVLLGLILVLQDIKRILKSNKP